MAYTLFDLVTLSKLQKSLEARHYDRRVAGTSNADFLYGDGEVIDPTTHSPLVVVNDSISAGTGDDAVYGGIGNDLLRGDIGNDFLDGGNGDDLLQGGVGNDILYGGEGKDFLDGGAGVDEMRGGKGEDTYVVDNVADQVIEIVELDVKDTVLSSVSFTLGANVEDLILTGSAAINATGNDLDNILYGNTGINTLAGGLGDDSYYVQNTLDVVNESSANAATEWNIVFSSTSFTLSPGSEIDEFILVGSTGVSATGNDEDNLIEGNAGSNRIYGGGGDDTLSGVPLDVTVAADKSHWSFITANLGIDQGADTLYGGLGNDMMFLGKTDRIVENVGEGIDTAVCGYSHVLEANVENLDFYGHLGTTEALKGTGNALNNWITSNLGADTLAGKLGDDSYEVFNSAVIVTELVGQGYDTVYAHVDFRLAKYVEDLVLLPTFEDYTPLMGFGNGLDNRLWGNVENNVLDGQGGNDRLYGGLGNDQLTGGAGADTFVFDTPLNADDNVDTIHDFLSGVDTIELDSSVFSALALGSVAGADFVQGAGNGAAPAQLANEHLLFDNDSGTLFYDADGSGAGTATAVAVIHPGPSGHLIAATDFLVVV